MSDYNSSLPVRTENAGDVIAKIADATVTSQQLKVGADGSINVTDNGGSLTVDGSVTVTQATGTNLHAVIDSGSITVTNAAGASAVNIQDGGNSITVDGTVAVSNFPTTVDTNFGTVGANTIRAAAQIGNSTGAANFNTGATGAQTLRVEANQGQPAAIANSWLTKINDGTDTLLVNTDGSINVVVSDSTPGTSVNDYNTSAALAAAGTSNHDYTVTAGKTLSLNQIEASGSGKMKIEVKVETAVASGVFNTRFVQFNSTSNPNMSIQLKDEIVVAAGVRVRVIRTNKDNQAQDVYSTICGYEV
jgi:hypothetical protein